MNDAIKIAIAGVGKIARDQHLPALAANPGYDLIACSSRNAQVEGVHNYTSVEAMLAAEPDPAGRVALRAAPGALRTG